MSNRIKKLSKLELKAIRYNLAAKLNRTITQADLGNATGYTGESICRFEAGVKHPEVFSQLMRFIDKADGETVREVLGL